MLTRDFLIVIDVFATDNDEAQEEFQRLSKIATEEGLSVPDEDMAMEYVPVMGKTRNFLSWEFSGKTKEIVRFLARL